MSTITNDQAIKFLIEKCGYTYEDAIKYYGEHEESVKDTIKATPEYKAKEERLQKKRDYYKNVVKPKKDAAKQAMQIAVLFEEV